MWKRILLAVLGLVVTILVLGGIKGAQIGAMIAAGESFVPPPEAVSTAVVEEAEWESSLRSVGTVVAARGVTVSTEVPGLVTKLGFESGQKVKKGAVLVQLDTSIERASLEAAQATLELAELSLKRAKGLAKRNVNAPAELDSAEATARQARAQVDNIRAQIAKKTIRAPFSGRLGIRRVELGQILDPGTPLVELQDLDEVYVDFYLPQHELAHVAPDQTVKVTSDGHGDRVWQGSIQTIEPSVDVATRNVRIRAVFDNADGELRPGMFVEARVVLPPGPPVLAIPATAVIYAPYGDSVFVVEDAPPPPDGEAPAGAAPNEAGGSARPTGALGPSKVARQVFVELGERRGDFVAIRSGLETGQAVVSAGAFKLRSGMAVVVDNSKPLEPKLAPKPKDS